jgi:acyl-homoserine lactone synthase
MALVIRPHHRKVFAGLLEQMFRLRHRVFIERLGWKLDTDGLLEMDQFDHGGCLHVVALDGEGRVRATSRLTPSLEPNVTCDVLQARMGASFPRGSHIVEVSRHCVDPDLEGQARQDVLSDIRISQAELSRRSGWTHKLGVSSQRHIQPWIRSGLKVEILGAPFVFPGDSEYSFGWMVSRNAEKPNAILDMLGADSGRLQDPDEDPSLIERFGDRLRREA